MPLDARTRAAGIAVVLAFGLAFSVLAADLAWNVEVFLEVGDDRVQLTERYGEPGPFVPNATSVLMTLEIHNDRPIGYDAQVTVTAGDAYAPAWPDRGLDDEPGRNVLVDRTVDLGPGETARIDFTLNATKYARGSPAKGSGGVVGHLPLQVDVGSDTMHLFMSIVEEDTT